MAPLCVTAVRDRGVSFFKQRFTGRFITYRQIIAMFLPVLVDQTFVTSLSLFNTAIISSSGVAAVSAVNMVDSLNIFLVNVFIAVSTGGTVVVAQYKGSGNPKMIVKAAANNLSAVFAVSFCVSMLVVFLHGPMLNLLFSGAAPDVFHNAQIYLIGSGCSYCGIALVEGVCGSLRGVGQTRASLVLSLIMNLSYLLLNFLFINGLKMGVLGLAIAINVSRYLAAVCAIIFCTRINEQIRIKLRDVFHVDFKMVKRILYIGIPFSAEQMFFNGGKILTQTYIVKLGTLALATNAITSSLNGMLQIPSNALNLTNITVVGQCMGRHDVKDAHKMTYSFIGMSSVMFLITGAILLPLFHPLVSLFSPPAEIVPQIFFILMFSFGAQILFWAVGFITPSSLRAAGDAKFTSVVSMLSMWLVRVILGYLLSITLKMGIVGVWLAMDFEWLVRGVVFQIRLNGRKWYRHRVIQ